MCMGALRGADGKPIVIGDLWSITQGNNQAAGSKGSIFFTAGVQGEAQGLFGSLSPIPGSDRFAVRGAGSHAMVG